MSSFASSDIELGRTNRIKHQINTRTAASIKQPLRRVTVHWQEEVDKQIDDMLERKYKPMVIRNSASKEERWYYEVLCRLSTTQCCESERCISPALY